MLETISIKTFTDKDKQVLLKELGYNSDDEFVLDNDGNQVIDPYLEEPVKVSNMIILPGSTIILDNNPLSISSYLEEYADVKF